MLIKSPWYTGGDFKFLYQFKSPRYTGGDFMFLYWFVRCHRRRHRRRPQMLVHLKTFEQLFRFLSFLARLLALTCRLPDYILVDFRRDLDLHFSRSNMEFAISQSKMVRMPRNENQTYRFNSRAQMWPPGLTLAMNLTLNFQGQIWNFLYLSQKWSDCHETKRKHIAWTPGLKCDQWVLTLSITLTFEFWRSSVTLTFDHTHDLDHGFSWLDFEIAVSHNGRADWHCTMGVAVGHSWPWPFGDQGQVYGSTR